MRYSPLLALVAPMIANGRDSVAKSIRNNPVQGHRQRPRVEHADCRTSVERLRAGPVDVDAVLGNSGGGLKYFDVSFFGHEMLYWEQALEYGYIGENYDYYLEEGVLYFERWPSLYPDGEVFTDNRPPEWNDVIQGDVGNCYFLASIAGAAEFPELIMDMFDSRTQSKNDAGIYQLRFFVRGKPWVLDIDDQLLARYPDNPELKYARPWGAQGDMWPPLLEKGWAKVKGSYENSDMGVLITGLRSVTGNPAFGMAGTGFDVADEIFWALQEADEAGMLMAAQSPEGQYGGDTICGNHAAHAYSLISVFTLTEADGTSHDVYMMRDPWGTTDYYMDWSKDDQRWTDDLVAQVPYDVDPRTAWEQGMFIIPKELIVSESYCFEAIEIVFMRDDEGYTDSWYDMIDADESEYAFGFQVPNDASFTSDIDFLFVTVETYYMQIVPSTCIHGVAEFQGYQFEADSPVLYIQLFQVGADGSMTQRDEALYQDSYAQPAEFAYAAGDEYSLLVKYDWLGSPAHDFTVKVYSKHDTPIHYGGLDGPTNMLHTDGINTPTEFTGNDYTISQMVPEGETPVNVHDVTTHELECELAEAMMRTITTLDDHVEIYGHADAAYNGEYTFQDLWNERPHFKNLATGAHLYYYANNQDTGGSYWQLDTAAEAGATDLHAGGRWETVSCSNYMWDLNQWHWLDIQDAPIRVSLHNVNDGLEYVYIWDHPQEFFNRNYFRQGYYNAKPHFVTEEVDAHLYYFVEGLGIDNTEQGYWQFDYRDQICNARPGDEDWYYGGYFFSETDFDYYQDFHQHNILYGYGGQSVGFDVRMATEEREYNVDLALCEPETEEHCAYTDGEEQAGFLEYITVEGHSNDFYNGRYDYASHWNCEPHFESSKGAHIFYYSDWWGSYWHLDYRNQETDADVTVPGSADWYEGGYFWSYADYQWKWDLNGERDGAAGGMFQMWLSHPNDGIEYVAITGHDDETYNGDYYRLGYWNGKPHWAKLDNTAHLYFYSFVGENIVGYWQLDHQDQWFEYYPGWMDLYRGGYWYSTTRYNYAEDFNSVDTEINMDTDTLITLALSAGDPASDPQLPPRGDLVEGHASACPETFPEDDVPDVYIEIEGHVDKAYDGKYQYHSHWNCMPHFKNDEGSRIYFYVGADSLRWHLDSRDQADFSEIRQYTRGGWFDSLQMVGVPNENIWQWDLNRKVFLEQQDVEVHLKMKHVDDGRGYVTVSGHDDASFNGNYFRDGYWNGQPHFMNENEKHLYYYNTEGEVEGGYWQFDWRSQWDEFYPGNIDSYSGGFWEVSGEVNYLTNLAAGSITLQTDDDAVTDSINLVYNAPAPCTSWWGCEETVIYEEDSPCSYSFDPSSVYNAVGIPVLNGQSVYTLAQLYDQTINLFMTLFQEDAVGWMLTANECR